MRGKRDKYREGATGGKEGRIANGRKEEDKALRKEILLVYELTFFVKIRWLQSV